MGMIEDRKKFKTTKEQTYPTNPSGNIKNQADRFNIDEPTIKKQQNKK